MAKILRGVIDDGTREIPLVNKFGKLICNVYIRPADFSIIDRYNTFMQDFEQLIKPLEELSISNDGTATLNDDWPVLKSVEAELKKKINELFDMDEADEIFAKRNPFSSVGGEFFCLRVLQALEGVIAEVIDEEAKLSQKRMAKYLSDNESTAKQTSEVNKNAGSASEKS